MAPDSLAHLAPSVSMPAGAAPAALIPEAALEPDSPARRRWHALTGFLSDGGQPRNSLFGEILDWVWVPVMLLMPMSIMLTFAAAKSLSNAPFDRALADSVQVLAEQVKLSGGRVVADLPLPARAILRADDTDTVYFQIVGQRGEFIAGDRDLPQPPEDEMPQPGEVVFRADEMHGAEVRIAYTWVSLARAPQSGAASASKSAPDVRPALVQVAETLDKRAQLANEIVTGVILPQFIVLPLAVVLIWLGLARGLGPLSELVDRIYRRRPGDLSPIDPAPAPEEVQPLIRSINELMQQLDANLKGQQRFIANAAHQLRTPLAGMKMQTELALRQAVAGEDAAELRRSLEQMVLSTERATRMVNQLLALTRAEKGAQPGAAAPHLGALDLGRLAEERVRDWVPKALAKRIDLGFDIPPGVAVTVAGDALLLSELLSNLIDNAIRYTPAGGVVTVRVRSNKTAETAVGDAALLEVEDSGIGIVPAERELVFERFYRVLGSDPEGENLDGSGLGLAIVREIAYQHRALVRISARERTSGCLFTVVFPPSAAVLQSGLPPDVTGSQRIL